jgi:hypothetical protein
MAEKTKCQTPGAQYHISIKPHSVSAKVDLPSDVHVDDPVQVEGNVHNAMELALASLFNDRRK